MFVDSSQAQQQRRRFEQAPQQSQSTQPSQQVQQAPGGGSVAHSAISKAQEIFERTFGDAAQKQQQGDTDARKAEIAAALGPTQSADSSERTESGTHVDPNGPIPVKYERGGGPRFGPADGLGAPQVPELGNFRRGGGSHKALAGTEPQPDTGLPVANRDAGVAQLLVRNESRDMIALEARHPDYAPKTILIEAKASEQYGLPLGSDLIVRRNYDDKVLYRQRITTPYRNVVAITQPLRAKYSDAIVYVSVIAGFLLAGLAFYKLMQYMQSA